MKIQRLILLSAAAMISFQAQLGHAQSKNKSGFTGSLISGDGTVFYEPLVAEGLLISNPNNEDEAAAIVVCKTTPVHEQQGAYWKNSNCKIQNVGPKAKPCKPQGKVAKAIDLKPEYTSTIEKYAKTKIDMMPPGPVNDLAVAYVSCTMQNKDERRPSCQLTQNPPKYLNCSEEDADTDNKGGAPRKAAPQKKGNNGGQ